MAESEWVWVKPDVEQPYRAGVWHLTRWAVRMRRVVRPACADGQAAERWVPWLNGPEETPAGLCRVCLYRAARADLDGAAAD